MNTTSTPTALQDFEIDVCRIGYGHGTISVKAVNEFEAGQLALDVAGDHSYQEKSSVYELSNPCPNPADLQSPHEMTLWVEMESTDSFDKPVSGVQLKFNQADIDRLQFLFNIIETSNLSEIREFSYPDWIENPKISSDGQLSSFEQVLNQNTLSFTGYTSDSGAVMVSCRMNKECLFDAFKDKVKDLVVLYGTSAETPFEFLTKTDLPLKDLAIGNQAEIIENGNKLTATVYASYLEDYLDDQDVVHADLRDRP